MPDDNNSKLEQILSELPQVKREILENHLNTLSEDERAAFIKEVIAEYESIKKIAESKLSSKPQTSKEPESVPKSDVPDFPVVTRPNPSVRPGTVSSAPIHTKKQKKSKAPVVVLCSLLSLALVGGIVFAIVTGKIPGSKHAPAESETTIPATQMESKAPAESETTAQPTVAPLPTVSDETDETTSEPTEAPKPTSVPLKSNAPNLKGIKIVIDPGHQAKSDYKKEPFKKGTKTGKPRCTSGTTGVVTNQKEYELTLDTALMLKDYLEQCGATVILTRDKNDVNISNKERAKIAVKAKPTLFLRLHADAGYNSKVKGVRVYIPKSGKLNKKSYADKLGKLVAKAGKTNFRGSKATNKYTGLNYATSIRSYQIVLGYLSHKDDDQRLADPNNRYEMCAAIATFCSTFKKG